MSLTKGILESLKLKWHCEMCGATNKKPKSVLEHHKDEFQLEPAFNPSGQPMTLCRDCRIGSAELLASRKTYALVTVSGGIADVVLAEGGAEIDILDFDNLESTDAPDLILSDREWEYLKEYSPDLFAFFTPSYAKKEDHNPSGQPMTLCRDCRIGSAELLADRYAIGRANKLLEHIADFLEAFQSEDEHLSSPNGCTESCEACAEEGSYFDAAKTVRALVDEREAGKYLVVSYDADQQQWHYDVIFAANEYAAKTRVLTLRDYCTDADVIEMSDLQHMSKRVQAETLEESEKWLAELSDERDTNEDAKTESEEA